MGRNDGDLVAGVGPLRRMLPSLMPSRNGAVVYYEQQLDLSNTLPWICLLYTSDAADDDTIVLLGVVGG